MHPECKILSLADLRAALANGIVPSPAPMAALAFFDLAERACGPDLYARHILGTEAAFTSCFPNAPCETLLDAFGDSALYGRWRRSTLRHVELANLWDQDPYKLLSRFARLANLPLDDRNHLIKYFPELHPRDITRARAIAADRPLRRRARQRLRNCLTVLDKLRDCPHVRRHNLLGPDPIGQLPQYRDGDKNRIELPTALQTACKAVGVRHAKHARRAFELAIDLGVLDISENGSYRLTVKEARRYLSAMPGSVSPETGKLYLNALTAVLKAHDPAAVPNGFSARQEGRKAPKKQTARKLQADVAPFQLPAGIEADVVKFANARGLTSKREKTLRRILERYLEFPQAGAQSYAFDDAVSRFDILFSDLKPGTRQTYRSVFRLFLKHSGRESTQAPWDQLLNFAKSLNSPSLNMRGLSLLRRLAHEHDPNLPPAGITRDVASILVTTARAELKGHRFTEGVRSLDMLRPQLPDLLSQDPIGSFEDGRKRGNLDLPKTLETALQDNASFAGYTLAGTKALLVAVRKLYSVCDDQSAFEAPLDEIPFAKLLTDAITAQPEIIEPYRNELRRLAERAGAKWSAGWHQLQQAIVAAGVSRRDNPLEALLAVAGPAGYEPWTIDREWAWRHERTLRPDLRDTWSRNVVRFDALRNNTSIAATGLLPSEPLGPMPARGNRIKHAVYPLPRSLEAELVGETKQILEAVHFIWRCGRDFGIWHRADRPDISEILSDKILETVRREQTLLGKQPAKLHVDRMRDWRESRAVHR